jgi:hypothetical protein
MFGILILISKSEYNRFEPAPVQVLLTEEISGSLRQLKVTFFIFLLSRIVQELTAICYMQGCCNLARDRYKSIEKRGILAPNKKIRYAFLSVLNQSIQTEIFAV